MIRVLILSLVLYSITVCNSYGQSLGNIYDAVKKKPKAKQKLEQKLEQAVELEPENIDHLITALKERGYYVSTSNKQVLEKYLSLDNLLTVKYDSICNVVNESTSAYSNVSYTNIDEATSKAIRYMYDLRDIRKELKSKYRIINRISTGAEFEADILAIGNDTDTEKIEYIVQTLSSMHEKQQQTIIAQEQKESELQQTVASLPSKEAVRVKFRTYKHRTGYTFEMFPVGFTPKAGKPVTDRVFGRKAQYREVDENGFNNLVIEYYDSGSILSVTVYNGSNSIYSAKYRDHAKKPYEIRSTSSDGEFYIVHTRIYDMYTDKTNEKTKYQYVPLDYWYE